MSQTEVQLIKDAVIVNADVSGSAAIDVSKISGAMPSAGGTFTDDVTFTGASANLVFDKSANALEFADNAKAAFGTSDDLKIFHDGTDSTIDNDTGALYIKSNASTQLLVNNTENAIIATANGAVDLYHDNSKKFETTSAGATVTGSLTATGFATNGGGVTLNGANYNAAWVRSANTMRFNDNAIAGFGSADDLKILHDGSNSFVTENGTGDLLFTTTSGAIKAQKNTGENMLTANVDGAVELYYDNTKMLETFDFGVIIPNATGNLGIQWGPASNNYCNIWAEYGSGDLFLAGGLKPKTTNAGFFSSYTGNFSRNAIQVNAFGNNGIQFYASAEQNVAKDSAITVNEIARVTPNGITFNGDSAAANALDDYEEGTYSPALGANGNISGGNGLGCTYTTQTGYYVKIGSFVFCNGILVWNAKSGTLSNTTVNLTLSIPFAMGGTGNQGAGQLSYNSAIDFNTDSRNVHGVGSNAYIFFERVATGTGKHLGYVKTQNLDSSGQINFAFSYRIL